LSPRLFIGFHHSPLPSCLFLPPSYCDDCGWQYYSGIFEGTLFTLGLWSGTSRDA
jgi:hypothetical protein